MKIPPSTLSLIFTICLNVNLHSMIFYDKAMGSVYMGDLGAIQKCLDDGFDINSVSMKVTMLTVAIYQNFYKVVEFLVKSGADVNKINDLESKKTPLMYVFRNDLTKLSIIKLLVDNGANLEARDSNGNTPLMIAVKSGHKEGVEFLLKKDVNILAKNNKGQTAFDIAIEIYECWHKEYNDEETACKFAVWLKYANHYKEIAKLIFEKFIKMNDHELVIKDLINIIKDYSFNKDKA